MPRLPLRNLTGTWASASMSPVKGCTAGARVYRASPSAIASSSFSFNTTNNNSIRTYTTPSKPVSASPAYATQSHDQDNNNDMPAPVRTQQQWADFGKAHVTHGLGRLREEVMVKGEGVWLYNADGQKYLDFTAGIGVTNLGHCHPEVSAAAAAQVHQLVHLQCSIAFHPAYLQLIERLLPAMPDPSLDSFFFWNSGSEAVEAAIKLARFATKKTNIICFQGAYHGRTYGSTAVTKSKTVYFHGTGPTMPGVFTTAYPYWHSLGVPQATSEEEVVRQAKHQLDLLLRQQTAPKDTAAIIIEPVQGEGGYVPCPPAFMQHLREVCDKHNILLICDEVQSGFFRTGTYFNVEQSNVRPDILIMAKGLANGYPLSGIVSRKELMDTVDPGAFGGTYAGNAVACAAGVAAQEVYQMGDIEKNVAARSKQLFTTLHDLASSPKTSKLISEVRGQGLMVAMEFRTPSDELSVLDLPEAERSSVPKDIGKRVQKICIDQGLLILTTSCFDTIRFIPALTITEDELAHGLSIFKAAVEQVAREGNGVEKEKEVIVD